MATLNIVITSDNIKFIQKYTPQKNAIYPMIYDIPTFAEFLKHSSVKLVGFKSGISEEEKQVWLKL